MSDHDLFQGRQQKNIFVCTALSLNRPRMTNIPSFPALSARGTMRDCGVERGFPNVAPGGHCPLSRYGWSSTAISVCSPFSSSCNNIKLPLTTIMRSMLLLQIFAAFAHCQNGTSYQSFAASQAPATQSTPQIVQGPTATTNTTSFTTSVSQSVDGNVGRLISGLNFSLPYLQIYGISTLDQYRGSNP